MEGSIRDGIMSDSLCRELPAGAARNALDCALLDLEAKKRRSGVAEILDLDPLRPVETAYTLSLSSPENMAEAARAAAGRTILKLKLGAMAMPVGLPRFAAPRPGPG
jgi:L-alanine-DL-glutamate epimerase-like enolase superfamily enzyme